MVFSFQLTVDSILAIGRRIRLSTSVFGLELEDVQKQLCISYLCSRSCRSKTGLDKKFVKPNKVSKKGRSGLNFNAVSAFCDPGLIIVSLAFLLLLILLFLECNNITPLLMFPDEKSGHGCLIL